MKKSIFIVATVLGFLSGCASSPKAADVTSVVEKELGFSSERFPAAFPGFTTPPAAVFDDIRDYAQSRRYTGYDILACFDNDNKKLKMGGTFHWSLGYQLFLQTGSRMDMGVYRAVSPGSDKYTDGSLTFEMVGKGHQDGLGLFIGTISNKEGKKSEPLKCYMASSGLE